MAERPMREPAWLVESSAIGVRRLVARAALALLVAIVPPFGAALAQPPSGAELEKLRAETAADHAAMLARLGIRELRPGPSGDESKPDHANYDESLANPYPALPDPLTLKSGAKVATADSWWDRRRPEIVADFEREVVGRVPANAPRVSWATIATREWMSGRREVVGRQLVGTVDNSEYPAISVEICLTLVLPAGASTPAPVMIMLGGGALPEAAGPEPAANDSRVPCERGPVFAPRPAANAPPADPPATEQLLAAGWGFASLSPTSVQADNGAGLTRGIIGLVNRGARRSPEDWGALRAWAWGASRALEFIATEPGVDARRIGVEGVSRYGKAALVAMAFDRRFAVVLVGSSGEGGAKLHRRRWGEQVENLTASGEYHWMAGNFLKYGAAAASFGSMNPGDLPVDAHELIALCAPRPTFISYGVPEQGDAKWLDQRGSFMAAVAAQPVFRLLGARDLGVSDDYANARLPPVGAGLLDGELAWRQHDGGHTDGPNWKYFIPWADRMLGR
jgi:(4-O-methyl)-D-glucuronate---lignin esterase